MITGGGNPPVGWRGEICKRCNCRNPIGFKVPDEIWNAVSRGRFNILCPRCFDEEAELFGIVYRLSDLSSVTWSDVVY